MFCLFYKFGQYNVVDCRSYSSTPAPAPAATPMAAPMAQPKQPGLIAQMAATAGGVAIGSTVVSRSLKRMETVRSRTDVTTSSKRGLMPLKENLPARTVTFSFAKLFKWLLKFTLTFTLLTLINQIISCDKINSLQPFCTLSGRSLY